MRTMRARIRGAFGVQILACRCVIVSVLGRGFLEPDRACMRYVLPTPRAQALVRPTLGAGCVRGVSGAVSGTCRALQWSQKW